MSLVGVKGARIFFCMWDGVRGWRGGLWECESRVSLWGRSEGCFFHYFFGKWLCGKRGGKV
jgi:hypothetical protein